MNRPTKGKAKAKGGTSENEEISPTLAFTALGRTKITMAMATTMAMAITVMVTAMATATGQVMATEVMVAMAETAAANEDI